MEYLGKLDLSASEISWLNKDIDKAYNNKVKLVQTDNGVYIINK